MEKGPSPVRLGPQFGGNRLNEEKVTVNSRVGAAQIWTYDGHMRGRG